jgi:hypothetical protein
VTLSDTGLRKKFSVNSPQDQDLYDVVDKNNKVVFSGAEDDADYFIDRSLTKFGQYTLPGGKNYRELVLTMPSKNSELSPNEFNRLSELKSKNRSEAENIEYQALNATYEAKQRGETSVPYRSSHFPEQENPLAHIRVNDRIDSEGKKMLLIEEVQSDWHQAGREKGYKGQLTSLPDDYFVSEMKRSDDDIVYEIRKKSDPDVLINRDYNRQSAINGAVNLLNETVMGVPDAPFKDTWYQLALKRAIQHAAENGYDRIGLTTGSQQAKRFDLSQQIGQINARPTPDGKIALEAMTPDMGSQVFNKVVNANELDGIVGKEIAEKIKNQIEYPKSFDDRGKSVELSGLDLQVGGEGMKKYYDEIYPKFLDKYGKKWGAKIGETKVNTVMERAENSMVPQMGQEGVRYLDITPEMKAGVSKGQPLFAAVPAIPAAGLLAPQEKRR